MFYIAHSAEGSVWEKHKYLKRIDGKYYYPDSYEGGRHLSDLNKKRSSKIVSSKQIKATNTFHEKKQKKTKGFYGEKELKQEITDSSIEKIAKEIISGKYGNGNDARRKALGMSAEEYEIVRKKVNEIMRGSRGGKAVSSNSKSAVTSAPIEQKSSTKKEKKKKTTKKSGGLNMDKVYRVYK